LHQFLRMDHLVDVKRDPARLPQATDEERAYYARNQSVYAWFARRYDAVTWPIRHLRQKVVEAAALPPGARVLDVATGTGAQALAFADAGMRVIGVDLSEAMLARARVKRPLVPVSFIAADATHLPFAAGHFDAACISFALHEMPASIRRRVLDEMVRVTRDGGRIIVVDYALPVNRVIGALSLGIVGLYERDHYYAFVHSDLRGPLHDAGVVVATDRRALLGNVSIVVGDKVAR